MPARINPGGGVKQDKIWRDALHIAIKRPFAGAVPAPKTKLDALVNKLVENGLDGDMSALKEIGDRLDGKAAQAITGDDGGPVTIRIVDDWARNPPAA